MSASKQHKQEVDCDALRAVFELLGKRWSGLIVGTLLEGPARFSEIARLVPDVSERMLSGRLGELVAAGLLERVVDDGPPVHVTYRLTRKGQALRPALHELGRWAHEELSAASLDQPSATTVSHTAASPATNAASATSAASTNF